MRRSASQDIWRRAVLFSRRETRRKGAPCIPCSLVFSALLSCSAHHPAHRSAQLRRPGHRSGRRSRWPRRAGRGGPAHRRHVRRRQHADAVAPGNSRSTCPTPAPSRSASRSTVSAASRCAITGASAERDLGKIALEISAVSESVVVSAAQVEIPLSTTSSSVTVITRDDLNKHQVESVADALRLSPGCRSLPTAAAAR